MCGGAPYHRGVPASVALRLWLPVVLWAAVIFAFSSVPDLGTGLGTWDLVLRKLAHAAEFALLGALLMRALREELPALALGIAYAASDELHQHFVTGRVGSPLDVLIDSVGVAVGVLLWRRYGLARLSGASMAVRGRRGQYGSTDSESRVPPAARGGAGGRLRRPGGDADR
jgi:VanZ family protein